MKTYIRKSEYMDARNKYLRMIKRYEKQGYDMSKFTKPAIPKRPTKGSISNLLNLEKKVKQSIHEQRVETGYYTRMRETQNALRKATPDERTFYKSLGRKEKGIYGEVLRAAYQKVEPKSPKKAGTAGKKPKTTKQVAPSKDKAKAKIKVKTSIPKVVKDKTTQPPNLSDAVLRAFESEMTIAQNYVSRSAPYQSAVNKAGHDAFNDFVYKINEIVSKHMPDITNNDVRIAVSKKLNENFGTYIGYIESYLFEFVSDGGGGLNHTQTGLDALKALLNIVSDSELTLEEKKTFTELENAMTDGEMTDVDDVTEGVE